jgi:hypothetical protein
MPGAAVRSETQTERAATPSPRLPVASSQGGAAQLLELQRTAGNAAVGRLLRREGRLPPRGVVARRTLARYSHSDCEEDDLKKHIWPADWIARQMVKKAIWALTKPVDPAAEALFSKYFMTSTPNISKILHVFREVRDEFDDNDYTYECEDDCKSTDNGYTWGGWIGSLTQSHIHLCMPNFRSRSNECLARTIVHEFTHRYADTDDNGYCKSGCGYDSCPSDLTEAKALENADSYACFAYELWPATLAVAMP